MAAGDITIEFAIKKDADSWTQIDFLRIFIKINIFIIFPCRGAPGTRPEAPGTLGIDSTSIEKIECFGFCIFFVFCYFFSLPLHIPSFGTISGSRDPSRIVDLAERFILVYSLSLPGPLRCLFRLGQGYVCSCNTTYVLLQHNICALATHHMCSCNTPYVLLDDTIWIHGIRKVLAGPPLFSI